MNCLKYELYINVLTNNSVLPNGIKLYGEMKKIYQDNPSFCVPKCLSLKFKDSAHMNKYYMRRLRGLKCHFEHHEKFPNAFAKCYFL
jgi:hypothetical protein